MKTFILGYGIIVVFTGKQNTVSICCFPIVMVHTCFLRACQDSACLLAHICIDDYENRDDRWQHGRFAAIRELFEGCNENFNKSLIPEDYLSLDETLYPIVFFGKLEEEPNEYYISAAINYIKDLVSNLGKRHRLARRNISMDRLYASFGWLMVGKFQANRVGLPPEVKRVENRAINS